jgi:chromosome segregation ATPase
MPDKQVKIEVTTEANLDKVQSLEAEINKITKQKIQLDIDTNTSKLEEVNSKIESTKAKLQELKGKADVDDSEIKKVEQELDALEADKINLELAIETGKLNAAKMEVEELDNTTIDVDVNNISAMEAVDQIGQGFDRLKQGASEIGAQLGTVLDAAGKQETNRTFLEMSVGADQAAKSLETINSIVRDLPGDDTALQGLLSSATAKNASLTAEEL